MLSPPFLERGSESEREEYRRFVKDALPMMEDVLEEYSRQLISTAVDRPYRSVVASNIQ